MMGVTVLMIAACNLTVRAMNNCNPLILQIPYNLLPAIVFAVILTFKYFTEGVVPFSSINSAQAIFFVVASALMNFFA